MADQQPPPPRVFDAEAFHKEFDLAQNIAEGIHTAVKTPAIQRKQAGQDILVFRCPKCNVLAALSAPGKHLCRGCHAWLEIERAG